MTDQSVSNVSPSRLARPVRNAAGWTLLVGLTIAAIAGIGTPFGHSYDFNLAWFEAFDAQLRAGVLYPRRLPDLWAGHGGADFFFYGPLPFWVSSLSGAVLFGGGDAPTRWAIGGAVMLVASGLTMFAFARSVLPQRAAAFAAVVYVILPYHFLVDWMMRQAVGEVAAMVFLPLLLLAYLKLQAGSGGGRLFALAYAGLVLSHLPSALLAGHLVLLLFAYEAWRCRREPVRLAGLGARLAGWTALALALSALYWLPALTLLDTVTPGMLSTPYFDPKAWLFFDGRPEPAQAEALKLTFLCSLVIAAAGWIAARRIARPGLMTLIAAPTLLCAFLVLPVSWLFWEVSPLARIQFPWRSFILMDLSLGLATGSLFAALTGSAPGLTTGDRRRLRLGAVAAGVAFALAVQAWIPGVLYRVGEGAERAGRHAGIGPIEYLPPESGAVLTRALQDTGKPQPTVQDAADLFVAGIGPAARLPARASRNLRRFEIDLPALDLPAIDLPVDAGAKPIALPLLYWAPWQAYEASTGAPVDLKPAPDTGIMTVSPQMAGRTVIVELPVFPVERFGGLASALALLVLLASLAIRRGGPHRRMAT